METDKIKTLEEFKDFASYHFKVLKPAKDMASLYAGIDEGPYNTK